MAKPTELPRWASVAGTGADGQPHIEEAPNSKKDSGWQWKEKPPRQWQNWFMNLVYKWLSWFDDREQNHEGRVSNNESAITALQALFASGSIIATVHDDDVVETGSALNVTVHWWKSDHIISIRFEPTQLLTSKNNQFRLQPPTGGWPSEIVPNQISDKRSFAYMTLLDGGLDVFADCRVPANTSSDWQFRKHAGDGWSLTSWTTSNTKGFSATTPATTIYSLI